MCSVPQCVQKPLQSSEDKEMDDAKEETKQEPTQRPAAPSPEAYHSARRGKRMKSEVRVAADGTSIDQEQLVHIPCFSPAAHLCEDGTRRPGGEPAKPAAEDGFYCHQTRTR